MKSFLFIFFILFSYSCSNKRDNSNYKPSVKQKITDQIRYNTAQKIKRKTGLIPCGTGGQMMYEIEMLALAFDHYGSLDIEKSRELLVSCIQEFTAAVNENEKIRPYLANYPFLPKNVDIRIFIRNPDAEGKFQDKLEVVSSIKGILKYKIDDPNGPLFKTVLQETYEEAVAKLEAKNDFRIREEKTAVGF